MSDQNFREIQLGGKQLVFLFMASVVLAVAIFLLGVSVGRGVKSSAGSGSSETEVLATPAAAPLPAKTEMTAADTGFDKRLPGAATAQPQAPQPAAPAAEPTAAPSAPPPAVAETPGKATAAVKPAPTAAVATPPKAETPKPAVTPPKPEPAKPAAKPTDARSATGGWSLQAGAFRSRENADKQVAMYKEKGFSAFVVAPTASSSLYHVRVGPFSQRAEAEAAAERLKIRNPSVSR